MHQQSAEVVVRPQPGTSLRARKIPEHSRLDVLPKYFGKLCVTFEHAVYRQLEELSDYTGGFWDFFELEGGGFYMAPVSEEPFTFDVAGNYFQGTLSAEAAGITACLFAYSLLSFAYPEGPFSTLFHTLRDQVHMHPEAHLIFAAID